MGEFYITKVVAKGSGKTDSVIDLRPGLNIIRGRSNTGKTCIIKCIDFCFGSKAKPLMKALDMVPLKSPCTRARAILQSHVLWGKTRSMLSPTFPVLKAANTI